MTTAPKKKTEPKKRGRPRKIKSPAEFDRLVDSYIAERTEKKLPITLNGALLHLGLYDRHALMVYETYDEFFTSVKRLRSLVADAYEQRLHGNSPTGAIFALKNMGWSDKQEHEHTGKDGGPIQTIDLSGLSDGELGQLNRLIGKAADIDRPGDGGQGGNREEEGGAGEG